MIRNLARHFFSFAFQKLDLLLFIIKNAQMLADSLRYDCVVLDPPWMNKSVKRKRLLVTMLSCFLVPFHSITALIRKFSVFFVISSPCFFLLGVTTADDESVPF